MEFKFLTLILICLICYGKSQQKCENLLNIFSDASNSLSQNHFTIQQTFISFIIRNINNLKKVEYGKYAESDSKIIIPWNSNITKSEYINTIIQTKQWNKPVSIYRAFHELALAVLSDHTLHFSSIIFITDTSNNEEINRAIETYKHLLKPKVSLALIATGDKALVSKLAAFEVKVFDWTDLTKPYPIGWDLNVAQGCVGAMTTVTSTFALSSTTTTPQPYIPCAGKITVLSDTSNVLSTTNFQKQLNFASSFLAHVSNPERIQYGSYSSETTLISYKWNHKNTESELQTAIKNTTQSQSAIERLGNAMQILSQNNGTIQTAIIFVADTSSNFDILKAYSIYKSVLKDSIKITFILTGEKANAESLFEFGATVFDWRNMNLELPNEWNVSKAFGCF